MRASNFPKSCLSPTPVDLISALVVAYYVFVILEAYLFCSVVVQEWKKRKSLAAPDRQHLVHHRAGEHDRGANTAAICRTAKLWKDKFTAIVVVVQLHR